MAITLPVSVIISSRNRPHLLAETVASILDGDARPAEIVIIDQSDAPASLPIVVHDECRTEIRHLWTGGRGLSRGRNEGAAAARFDLLVFVDDDMTADRRWLSALVQALTRASENDVVTGRVVAGPQEVPGGFVPALAPHTIPASYTGRLPIDVLAGGNMALRRTAFDAVGRFDVRLGPGTGFPAAEDNDLGFRLLEAGGKVIFVPDALLAHRAWRRASAYLALRYAYGRGKGAFYAKHMKRSDRHMLWRMVRDVSMRPVRALRRAHHPRIAAGEVAYAAGVVRGAVQWRWSALFVAGVDDPGKVLDLHPDFTRAPLQGPEHPVARL